MQPVGAMVQFAYVVSDIHSALKYWTEVLNVGPFFLFEDFTLNNHRYRGKASEPHLSLALANSGDVQIELIAPNDDEPSVYREFLQTGGRGLHHIGYCPKDFDAEVSKYQALGCELALEGTLGDGPRIFYMDTTQHLGHFTELWENSSEIDDIFAMVAAAATEWDGSEPVRLL